MITTITTFRLREPISLDEARSIFLSTAPKYRNAPGLVRKCYVRAEDGSSVGGIYLWETRAAAETMYTEDWKAFVREKYGTEPIVTYLDSPVVVDNVTHEIITDE